jgi:hypothetical protein
MINNQQNEASAFFKQPKPTPTINAYAREQQAIRTNFERLKAERRLRSEPLEENSN